MPAEKKKEETMLDLLAVRKISLLLLQLSFCFPVLTKNDLAASEPL